MSVTRHDRFYNAGQSPSLGGLLMFLCNRIECVGSTFLEGICVSEGYGSAKIRAFEDVSLLWSILLMEDKHIRYSAWLSESTMKQVERYYESDQCRNKSAFIEKAILYYINYLNLERNMDILSPTLMSSLRAITDENTTRLMRLIFKLAVELGVISNIMAFRFDISRRDIDMVRDECIKELEKTNGVFDLKKAVKWQKGDETWQD